MARRLQDDERRISVNAFNPALMLDTQLARGYSTKEKLSLLFNNFGVSLRQILKFRNSKNMGKALSLIILNPELDGITGKYFDGFHQEKSSTESHDLHKAAELWQASKALVGLEESV